MGDVGVWAFLITGAVMLGTSVTVAVVPVPLATSHHAIATTLGTSPRYPVDSFARVSVARDLFRTDRRTAALAYDPARGTTPLPDGPPKPQLALTGVLWSAEPEAVIEGLPATTRPRVVRVGDVIGGVTIRRIEPTQLVATGFDTTWTLTLRRPWK